MAIIRYKALVGEKDGLEHFIDLDLAGPKSIHEFIERIKA